MADRDWRKGYPRHFRALVEAGLGGEAYGIASAELASVCKRIPLDDALAEGLERPLEAVTVELGPLVAQVSGCCG